MGTCDLSAGTCKRKASTAVMSTKQSNGNSKPNRTPAPASTASVPLEPLETIASRKENKGQQTAVWLLVAVAK